MAKGKKEEETTELAPQQQTALTTPNAPRRGFEEPVDRDELMIPRAKLLQALSPEVQEQGDKFQAGLILNSITKEPLPSLFIPIFKFTNWIRFNPRNSKDPNFDSNYPAGSIIWRSNDPYDPKVIEEGKFGADGSRPKATRFLNFFSYFPGVPMPIIVSFSNTSYKAGRQLLSLCQFSGGDMFARQYEIKSKKETNDMGTYFVLTVQGAGTPQDQDFKLCEKWWEEFHAKTLQVHEETEEVVETPAGTTQTETDGEPAPF